MDSPTSHQGKRIFSGKKNPDENINRKTVKVKAAVGEPNVRVYFKSFDVDDLTDDPIIDELGDGGLDNRHGREGFDEPYVADAAGVLSSTFADTNANGEAFVYLTVTQHPGDNFVVAASTDENYLQGVGIDGKGLKDSSNVPLPTTKAKRTEMLTVWRKVHIEVDKMGPWKIILQQGTLLIRVY